MNRRSLILCALAVTGLATTAQAAEHGAKKGEEATVVSEFIDMPTLTATVIRGDGRRGVLTVQAVLYAPKPAQRARAAQSGPLLMNAYVPAMQAWAYALPPGSKPNVDALGQTLQRATDGVLGPGARVLLGGVMIN